MLIYDESMGTEQWWHPIQECIWLIGRLGGGLREKTLVILSHDKSKFLGHVKRGQCRLPESSENHFTFARQQQHSTLSVQNQPWSSPPIVRWPEQKHLVDGTK
jgi:hypothetical protein